MCGRFAKIKGVAASEVEGVVALKIREMDLVKFENKTAGSLSGGNKRKLSVAIAMMGRPPLMFLDEVGCLFGCSFCSGGLACFRVMMVVCLVLLPVCVCSQAREWTQ